MFNLSLYERLSVSTTSYRRNITQIAQGWHHTTRAWGGYWMGDFALSPKQLTKGELVDFFNDGIGWRVVEKSYGITTWEGEIVQLRLTLDGVTWLRSLDPERWRNKIKVQWGGGETAWSEDTDSSDQYGESCYIDQASAVFDSTTADARRDKILAKDAFPRSRAESGLIIDPSREASEDGLSVVCAGYVFSMNRRYQETNIAAANLSANISTLVGNSEFVTAGRIDTNSTQSAVIVAGTPMRLWDCIYELIDVGDDSGNDYAGGVYADREFDYGLAETSVTHYLRNGRLYDAAGNPVLPTHMRPDTIVEIVGAPRSRALPGGGTLDKPNRAYIEEVEFTAPNVLRLVPRQPEPTPETLNEMTRRVIGFADKYAAFRHVVSAFSNLPGLRGLWAASNFDTSGNWEDSTNYDLLLSRNNAYFAYDGLVPYAYCDGSGDYFTRADEAAISITGAEAFIADEMDGLTLGGWFRSDDDTPAATEHYMSKMGASGSYSYYLSHDTDGTVDFGISDDGTNLDWVSSTATTSGWTFVVGRFCDNDAGEEQAVWVNNVKATDTTAMASIDDNGSSFQISGQNGANDEFTGRASICFLCAAALPDDMIGALFQQSRALYGV